MPKREAAKKQSDPLPGNFESLGSFWTFWDAHSTADYEHLMQDVEVTVNVRTSKTYCPLARDVAERVRDEAQRQGVSTETLVNLWLRDRVASLAA